MEDNEHFFKNDDDGDDLNVFNKYLKFINFVTVQVGVDTAPVSETHYKNLLTKLPSGHDALDRAYEAVEKIVRDVNDYVHVSLHCMFIVILLCYARVMFVNMNETTVTVVHEACFEISKISLTFYWSTYVYMNI